MPQLNSKVPALMQTALHHHAAGQGRDARRLAEQILRIEPKSHEALNLLGVIAAAEGNTERGMRLIRRAIAFFPEFPEAHNNLGNLLLTSQRPDEALASFEKAIALRPSFAEALYNRANALRTLGREEEAVAGYDKAIALRPDYAEAFYNRANALRNLDREEEALPSYERVIALRPQFAEAFNNYGLALSRLVRHAEAIGHYQRAVAIDPDFVMARWNESLSRLALGEMEVGWRLFEERWRLPNAARISSRSPRPLWQGNMDDLRGKTILLYAEQGLGDTLQFVRYVPLVAAQGARVLLEVQAPLVRLLAQLVDTGAIFAQGEPMPAHDYCCPLMSLPLAFETRVDTIPGKVPYLRADPALAEAWRERLVNLAGLRIGLVWAGNPRPFMSIREGYSDHRRSITLQHYRRLAEVPGISLVSLQKGEAAAETVSPPAGLSIHDWTQELGDFADTAALVEGLDLVISVDTSVTHLAGALGKPVWLLNCYDSGWRWLVGREDSPWYPTLRQFRQPEPGNWNAVMADLTAAVARVSAETR
jgi:tetratricopeptide (TPR) repeat protein